MILSAMVAAKNSELKSEDPQQYNVQVLFVAIENLDYFFLPKLLFEGITFTSHSLSKLSPD